ncbi:hypothetical protein C1H46_019206 [Malus baccata]|uniref:Band 7 domain-containing protein n=1 Tax=Malus baccata TaxID=106549 RepID=A0A540M8V3_MALBA|nr:hypothetical protein C1H46_019206 [Malus baccata]
MDPNQKRPGIPHNRPQPPPQGSGVGDSSAIFFVLFGFLTILAMTVLPTSSTISILHQVPEGHVGVYWRGGALLKTITDPGFHLKLPLVIHFEPVQVTLQTDEMVDKLDDETMAIELGPPNFKEAL